MVLLDVFDASTYTVTLHSVGAGVAYCLIDLAACFLSKSCLAGLIRLLIASVLALVGGLQDRLTALLLMLVQRVKRYLSASPT